MSDHWENVTDNVEALLDMVLAMYQLLSFRRYPQMLITSLDFQLYGRIAIGRLERGVLKEGMPISLVKRDGTITKSRLKNFILLKVLVVKKVQEVTAEMCYCWSGRF
jgi:GTP-binding protein